MGGDWREAVLYQDEALRSCLFFQDLLLCLWIDGRLIRYEIALRAVCRDDDATRMHMCSN